MAIAKKMRDRKALDAEIKNSLSGGIGEFELFFAEHWKALVVGGLAVVVAIGCIFGVRSWTFPYQSSSIVFIAVLRIRKW